MADEEKGNEKEKEKALGILEKDRVIISEESDANRIFNKGCFGSLEQNVLFLSLSEALFLMENSKLEVKTSKGKKMSRKSFMKEASEQDARFPTRYIVYKDIRQRGYITKTALKYGADYRVYPRGEKPGDAHAKWVLFTVRENDSFDWRNFASMMRVAHSVKKKLLVGVVDDEGDVTYYETHWTRP